MKTAWLVMFSVALGATLPLRGETTMYATPTFDTQGRSSTATPLDKTDTGNLAVGPVKTDDYFRTYLTFDLSSATEALDVTVKLEGGSVANENNGTGSAQTYTLFQLASDWDGAAQPGPTGTALATTNITITAGDDQQDIIFNTVALKDAFNAAIGGSLYLGVMCDQEGPNIRSFKWFASVEDVGKEPQLTYQVAGVSLSPTQDCYIRELSSSSDYANGLFMVGDTATATDYFRSCLAFDLTIPELSDKIIDSAALQLWIHSRDTGGSGNLSQEIDLLKLSSAFSQEGLDWTSRDGTNNWITPGGDFELTPLDTISANAGTVLTGDAFQFSSLALAAAADSAIGESLYLMLKLPTEDANRSIFRFASEEYPFVSAYKPLLVLRYSDAPPLGTVIQFK